MNQLLPMIRRQRRPLLVQDQPPVTAGNVEPVKVEASAGKAVERKAVTPATRKLTLENE